MPLHVSSTSAHRQEGKLYYTVSGIIGFIIPDGCITLIQFYLGKISKLDNICAIFYSVPDFILFTFVNIGIPVSKQHL